MAVAWTTDDLVEQVRLRARLSDNDPDFTDARILGIADVVVAERVTGAVASNRGGDYITTRDTTLVANQRDYRIPSRTLADTLESVTVIDAAGVETPLDQLDRLRLHSFTTATGGRPWSFCIEGPDVILGWDPTTTGGVTLRVRYTTRRSKMVPTASCAQISNVVLVSVRVDSLVKPTGFDAAATYDVVGQSSPFAFNVMDGGMFSVTAGPSPYTYLFDGDVSIADVSVGDWLCLTGQTPIVQLPPELYNAIASATASAVMVYLGDLPTANALRADSESGIAAYLRASARKVRDESIPIVNHNSALRSRSRRGGWMRQV